MIKKNKLTIFYVLKIIEDVLNSGWVAGQGPRNKELARICEKNLAK
jgi:hypothetical protein